MKPGLAAEPVGGGGAIGGGGGGGKNHQITYCLDTKKVCNKKFCLALLMNKFHMQRSIEGYIVQVGFCIRSIGSYKIAM